MHPITFTYDWGMVNDLARRNQARVVGKLGIEHIVISADIRTKRANIRKNLKAWLKRPDLGMVPILMAGDKQFYYYFHKVRNKQESNYSFSVVATKAKKELDCSSMVFATSQPKAIRMH